MYGLLKTETLEAVVADLEEARIYIEEVRGNVW